jgi:hypothetical protein
MVGVSKGGPKTAPVATNNVNAPGAQGAD